MRRKSVLLAVSIGLVSSACHQGTDELPYPISQRQFVDLNRGCVTDYHAGTNEIQRSLAFNSCSESRTKFAAHSPIRGWLGTIERISTDQGADVVSFRISTSIDGFDITYGTVSNRMSDARYGSLITQTHPLFGVLANLHEGDPVAFDGEFLGDPAGKIGAWEASMTERGSMEEPEFNIRFTKVQPFGDDVTTKRAPGASELARVALPPAAVRSPPRAADASSAPASLKATSGATPESDLPYVKRRAELLAEGYEPANAPNGELRHSVNGDPAVCGNAGCQVPWSKGDRLACVAVQVDDNLDEASWRSQQLMGACAY